MFKLPDDFTMKNEVEKAEANYIIQKNDLLQLQVYTNKGERILDQNISSLQSGSVAESTAPSYLVREDGTARFPLIDSIKIEGLKLQEAEIVLQNEYKRFYQEPFVSLNYSNKRAVVLGPAGGVVVPLTNENIRLTELLALAGNLERDFKAQSIRVLRGEQVLVADFSTIDGYIKSNYIIHPNDVIYIEPVRRPVLEAARDYGTLISLFTALVTTVVVIITLNQ